MLFYVFRINMLDYSEIQIDGGSTSLRHVKTMGPSKDTLTSVSH